MPTNTIMYPSVKESSHCPNLTEYGVELNYCKFPSYENNIIVCGSFLLPMNKDIRVIAQPHKSIVLEVNSFGRHVVVTPFLDIVTFSDDLKENGQVRRGFFHLNISEYIDTTILGDYYIICSLGTYLSNIELATIT